jgi:hypothetical protein
LMLDTSPAATGSTPVTKMMGMLAVASSAACAASILPTIDATFKVTSSAASFGNRSVWPFAQRVSIITLSFVYPDSRRPWRTAATSCPDSSARVGLRNPITGLVGCCARAVSGHAAAVLPTNVMNSRRLMASPASRTTSGLKRISHFGLGIVPFVRPKRAAPRPLWVKSGHSGRSLPCPLYPQKRTLLSDSWMSALCQKRTLD